MVQWQMWTRQITFFFPSPHAFIEYLPTGPAKGPEEIMNCPAPVIRAGGDVRYYGMCLGVG